MGLIKVNGAMPREDRRKVKNTILRLLNRAFDSAIDNNCGWYVDYIRHVFEMPPPDEEGWGCWERWRCWEDGGIDTISIHFDPGVGKHKKDEKKT